MKWHFEGCNFRPAERILSIISCREFKAEPKELPCTSMSSRYTRHCWRGTPLRTQPISLENVAGALQSPKGRTLNCHSPRLVQNAVLGLTSVVGNTRCSCPQRSREENQEEPTTRSRDSSMQGTSLSWLSRSQPPVSHLLGSCQLMSADDQGLSEGSIIPLCSRFVTVSSHAS